MTTDVIDDKFVGLAGGTIGWSALSASRFCRSRTDMVYHDWLGKYFKNRLVQLHRDHVNKEKNKSHDLWELNWAVRIGSEIEREGRAEYALLDFLIAFIRANVPDSQSCY